MSTITTTDLVAAADKGGYAVSVRADGLTIIRGDGGVLVATYPTKSGLRMDVHGNDGVDAHMAECARTGQAIAKDGRQYHLKGADAQTVAAYLVTALEAGTLSRTAKVRKPAKVEMVGLDALVEALVPAGTDEDLALVELIEAVAA